MIKVSNGYCKDTSSVLIKVEDAASLYIPNAFTPNGDGLNDIFVVGSTGIVKFQAIIFNKWGEKLFEWFDPEKEGWDGTLNGQLCKDDVYVYLISAKDKCDSKASTAPQKGTVTLVK